MADDSQEYNFYEDEQLKPSLLLNADSKKSNKESAQSKDSNNARDKAVSNPEFELGLISSKPNSIISKQSATDRIFLDVGIQHVDFSKQLDKFPYDNVVNKPQF